MQHINPTAISFQRHFTAVFSRIDMRFSGNSFPIIIASKRLVIFFLPPRLTYTLRMVRESFTRIFASKASEKPISSRTIPRDISRLMNKNEFLIILTVKSLQHPTVPLRAVWRCVLAHALAAHRFTNRQHRHCSQQSSTMEWRKKCRLPSVVGVQGGSALCRPNGKRNIDFLPPALSCRTRPSGYTSQPNIPLRAWGLFPLLFASFSLTHSLSLALSLVTTVDVSYCSMCKGAISRTFHVRLSNPLL